MKYKTFILIAFLTFLVLASSIILYGIATKNLTALLIVPLLVLEFQVFQYANDDDYHVR